MKELESRFGQKVCPACGKKTIHEKEIFYAGINKYVYKQNCVKCGFVETKSSDAQVLISPVVEEKNTWVAKVCVTIGKYGACLALGYIINILTR